MNKEKEENLPSGWIWVSLGDLLTVVRGASPRPAGDPRYFGGEIPWITVGSLTADDKVYLHSVSRFLTELGKNESRLIEPNTLLLTNSGATLGVPKITSISGCINDGIVALLDVDNPTKLYLYYFLRNETSRLRAVNQGAGQPNLNTNIIKSISVPLAPIEEQKRIIEEIEKQFSRLDEVIKSIKRMQKNLQKLRATTLKWACEGKLVLTEVELARQENREYESAVKLLERSLNKRYIEWEKRQINKTQESGKFKTNPKRTFKYKEPVAPNTKDLPEIAEGWAWATIEQLASFEPNSITDGPFGSNLKSEHYTKEGPRVIRLQNIGDGIFNDVFAHISEEHFENLKKHQVKEGDVVIAALGDTLPRACLIPEFVGEAIVKADCIRFNPNPELVSNEYVNFALNSESVRSRTTSIVHGVGRPRLNSTEIKAIAIPLPPLEEQKRIVAEVKRRFSVIESLETVVKTNLQRAESLRRKILQDAFAGKLVKQNPDDESASILLERIKKERIQRDLEAKRKGVKKPKIMKRKKVERRDIVEVLKESANKMTPEQLFHESGFNPDEVEEFYTELKKADNANAIEQEKDDKGSVYLTAKI